MYLEALHTGHTPHSNYDKRSARSLNDLCMNLPTHVNICGSLFHMKNRNFSSSFIWVKFGTKRANLENRSSLSGWLMVICCVNLFFFLFCKRSVSVCYCDDVSQTVLFFFSKSLGIEHRVTLPNSFQCWIDHIIWWVSINTLCSGCDQCLVD